MELRSVPTFLFRTALVVSVATLGAQAFTGNVPADFGPMSEVVFDGMDVGLPAQAPVGTISGWEIEAAAFEMDWAGGVLSVGLDFTSWAGDADGDTFEGGTSAWLAGNGGTDMANLAGTEAICVAFDFDQDMNFDVIAGVSALTDYAGFDVAMYNGANPLLPFAFGASMPAHMGAHMMGPDFEFELTGMMNLDPYNDLICFNFAVFSGSYADDGIGEDFMYGEVCLRDRGADAQDLASSFSLSANHPNPFNPTTTISFNMESTDVANLSVYNMMGQKVATLVDGVVGSGNHEVVFDASNLSSGVYFYTLSAGANVETRKMILTK